MPPDNFSGRAKSHVREAWHNYCLFLHLRFIEPDWALITLFYSALHLVQAHAVNQAAINTAVRIPANHSDRDAYVLQRLSSMVRPYRELQTASEDARYELVKRSVEAVGEYHDQEFTKIREYLASRGVSWDTRLTVEERSAVRQPLLDT